MINLSSNFAQSSPQILDLQLPLMAMRALHRFAEITDASKICIGGGFARGLYMQQVLGLKPQMNDIDLFADLAPEAFAAAEPHLEKEFGVPVRTHIGQFEREESSRGLIEFAVPPSLQKSCAGVQSIQLNFASSHPWANPLHYISEANIGLNQIAICNDGSVIASQEFLTDMTNKTMTMNPRRHWSAHDWDRTIKSLERMMIERPEFKGWSAVLISRPHVPTGGAFWEMPVAMKNIGLNL